MTDKEKLQVTADALPKVYKTQLKEAKGYELKRRNIYAINGEPITDHGVYLVPVLTDTLINHHKAIKRIFKHKGWQGVARYQQEVHQTYKLRNGN